MIGECEMTGKRNVELFAVKIEGTIMNVCKECLKYGERVNRPVSFKTSKRSFSRQEDNRTIVEDYALKIKQAREQKNLKQSQLANTLNIKESLLHKIESNHLRPSISLAIKLSKYLGIKLLEDLSTESPKTMMRNSSEPPTMESAILEALKKQKK